MLAVVAEMLFERFPDENEGKLARRSAALVRRETLAEIAGEIGLGSHIVMSSGEAEAGGRTCMVARSHRDRLTV